MSDGREYEIQTIDRLIATINQGDTCQEATELLRELISKGTEVITEHGGEVKGSITITLGFHFDAKGLDVTMKAKATMPPVPVLKERLFVNDRGTLTAMDPARDTMFAGNDLGRRRRETA